MGKLMLMPFFPGDDCVRLGLADELPKIVENDEQLDWLVQRALKLYTQWPGLTELHAVYGSKFKPRDGIETCSAVYPMGIPSGRGSQSEQELHEQYKALEKQRRQLPPANGLSIVATGDLRSQAQVQALAKIKRMPDARPGDLEIARKFHPWVYGEENS